MATALSQIPTTDYRLGFQSQEEETAVERLPVQGDVPPWLTGSLMRVTPAKLESGDKRVGHWFDGLAALNRFGFADGKVSYRSRFLDTKAYRAAQAGDGPGTGFGTDPCRSIFKRVQSVFSPDFTDNANVNLVRIGERYIAMTETPLPIEFDAETLATIGPLNFTDGGGGQVTTAHPHHDPGRNELVNYSARFSRKSEYRFWGLPAGSTARRPIASLPVAEPAYMHAFGMSERYLILAEYPLRVNPLKLAFSDRAFIKNYRWQPELGTRFQVVDRETGSLRGTYETDPFFAFHHVNAFERGDELVVDLVAYDDASIIDSLYLDERGPVAEIPPSELRRYMIGLDSGTVGYEALTEGHRRAAADRLRAPEHARVPLRVLRGRRRRQHVARPAREGRRGPRRGGRLGRGRLLSGRADLRPRAGRGGRGRRHHPLGGARHPRPALVPARARRRLVRRAGARRGAAPHPVRLPRPVPAMSELGLRVSDAEREAVAERLRQATAEGRLTPEELEERLGRALGALTRGELDAVVADLPAPRRRPRGSSGRRPELAAFASTALLLVAIWALSGMGYFWPAWPILGWGFFVLTPGQAAAAVATGRTAAAAPPPDAATPPALLRRETGRMAQDGIGDLAGAELARAMRTRLTVAALTANALGGLAAFAFGVVTPVPTPAGEQGRLLAMNLIAFTVFMVPSLLLGNLWARRVIGDPIERWLVEARPPTAAERELVVRQPLTGRGHSRDLLGPGGDPLRRAQRHDLCRPGGRRRGHRPARRSHDMRHRLPARGEDRPARRGPRTGRGRAGTARHPRRGRAAHDDMDPRHGGSARGNRGRSRSQTSQARGSTRARLWWPPSSSQWPPSWWAFWRT